MFSEVVFVPEDEFKIGVPCVGAVGSGRIVNAFDHLVKPSAVQSFGVIVAFHVSPRTVSFETIKSVLLLYKASICSGDKAIL